MAIKTILWTRQSVRIIDQTLLPHKLKYINCRTVEQLWEAIRALRVRGAPALGIAAAYGVLLGLKDFRGQDRRGFEAAFQKVRERIASSRPTAVNLFNALEDMANVFNQYPRANVAQLKNLLKKKASDIFKEDQRVCRQMARHGAKWIRSGATIMTICNAGALATADYGTALGVFYTANRQGKRIKVYACETRPLLQGARLTAWELLREKVDVTLICDNMAATLMRQGKIDAVFTGADRIAANGDTANKIGTYNLAVLAQYHHVPFYVVAPRSTFDLRLPNGAYIPIEERGKEEVLSFAGSFSAPRQVKAYNPAFDVTDHHLITGIVTEHGTIQPPFKQNIKKILGKF